MSAQSEFLDLLVAAMMDAAIEGKCTQLQTTISPPGKGSKLVRLVIIPEEMDFVRGSGTGQFKRPV